MKKILLINPGKDINCAVAEPLNLAFIAAYLEQNGVEVKIVDELSGENVEESIEQYKPDLAGITAVTPLALDAYRIADLCKKKGILTVMGGVHASVMPEEALKYVDVVVSGEGEQAMLDIVTQNISSGIVKRPFIKDLDSIPMPARHLIRMDFYSRNKDRHPYSFWNFAPSGSNTASILSSRGCPYSCTFCHNTWRETPYRCNSPERVISEIKFLIDKYKTQSIFFIEDNLFVNKGRLKKICELIKKNNINIIWGGNARVDNLDMEILNTVKEAGCVQVTFGFESGSQRMLNILNKRTTVEQNKKAIEMCKKVGLLVNGTLMIGNPTETMEDVELTRKFIKNNPIDSVGICITTAYPGTELWKWCESKKLIPESFSWSDFNYEKVPIRICENISPEELEKLRIKLYTETYLTKSRILRVIKIALQNPRAAIDKLSIAIKSFLKR